MNTFLIQQLRQQTGAGIVDCQKALKESGENIEKAVEILRKKGLKVARKKQDRDTKEGVIGSYIHSNQKTASLIQVFCETDFVARNEEFKELAHDLAMQITAMAPQYLSPEDVPQETKDKETEIITETLKKEGRPDNLIEKIIPGKLDKFYQETCLLKQKFIKDDKKTIEDIIKEKIQKLGENIVIGEFIKMEL